MLSAVWRVERGTTDDRLIRDDSSVPWLSRRAAYAPIDPVDDLSSSSADVLSLDN